MNFCEIDRTYKESKKEDREFRAKQAGDSQDLFILLKASRDESRTVCARGTEHN